MPGVIAIPAWARGGDRKGAVGKLIEPIDLMVELESKAGWSGAHLWLIHVCVMILRLNEKRKGLVH